jgi:hypothetical protein
LLRLLRLFRNFLGNDSRRLKAAACGCTIYRYKTLKERSCLSLQIGNLKESSRACVYAKMKRRKVWRSLEEKKDHAVQTCSDSLLGKSANLHSV